MNRHSEHSLRPIVGDACYEVWLEMLRRLVPSGRTHRLGTFVAGMLQYASDVANEQEQDPQEGTTAWLLLEAAEEGDPSEAIYALAPVIETLFHDAGVEYGRRNSKGHAYSIVDGVVEEYVCWYNMPWE